MKRLFCLIAIIGLFVFFTVHVAFTQDLGGQWFKTTFSVKGNQVGNNYFSFGDKASVKTVNYLQFVYNNLWSTACPAGSTPQFYPFYEIHVWYPVGAGWGLAVSEYIGPGTEYCNGILCPYKEEWVASEKTFHDKQFVTIGHGGWLTFGEGYADAVTVLDIKRDNGGVIKSATFKSYGCTSEFGDGWSLGSCTISGKLIKPETLPDGLDPAGIGPVFTTVDACVAP